MGGKKQSHLPPQVTYAIDGACWERRYVINS